MSGSTPTCRACSSKIDNLEYLECTYCLEIYEIKCLRLKTNDFSQLSEKFKETWCCPQCFNSKPKTTNEHTPVLPNTSITERGSLRNVNTKPRRLMKTCHKCNKFIEDRYFLTCYSCQNIYDTDCGNVSECRFRLMTAENKLEWRCYECIYVVLQYNKVHIEEDNLETQSAASLSPILKPHTYQDKTLSILSDDSTLAQLNATYMSQQKQKPETTEIQELKKEIEKLYCLLSNANNEVKRLKDENQNLSKKVLNLNITACSQQASTPINSTRKLMYETEKKRKINSQSPNQIAPISCPPSYTHIQKSHSEATQQPPPRSPLSLEPQQNPEMRRKPKLCIVSAIEDSRCLDIVSDTFCHTFEYCHFRNPNAGIRAMLQYLPDKLKNYTIKDQCIFMIGERDFNSTED